MKTPYIILYFAPDLSVMKILIPDIPKEGIDVEIQETLTSDSAVFTVHGRLRVQKAASEVMVEGNLKAEVELQCSRCLKKFRGDMSIPVDVVYHPVDELKGDDHHEIASEDLDLDFYIGDELDIDRLLKEQVALNIPMKPLCNDFCKGLCPNCGTDLNEDTCSCSLKITDSRFQELKKLLNERKE
jgi:DUF177 domain-containing protein